MANYQLASKLPGELKGSAFKAVMLTPGAILTLVLIIVSIARVIFLAFCINDNLLLVSGLSVDNSAVLLSHPLYWLVILRSLVSAVIVTLAMVLAAYAAAYYLAYQGGQTRSPTSSSSRCHVASFKPTGR